MSDVLSGLIGEMTGSLNRRVRKLGRTVEAAARARKNMPRRNTPKRDRDRIPVMKVQPLGAEGLRLLGHKPRGRKHS